MFSLKRNKGIGLLETIIYVSILALITVIVVNTTLVVVHSFGKSKVKRNIAAQGGGAIERVLREVRLAHDVDSLNSVLSSHPGKLKLNTIVSSTDDTQITREFFIESSSLMIQDGTASARPLTQGITITRLIFYEISNSTTSQAIRIEMTVKDGEGKLETSLNFYGTAVLRRSY